MESVLLLCGCVGNCIFFSKKDNGSFFFSELFLHMCGCCLFLLLPLVVFNFIDIATVDCIFYGVKFVLHFSHGLCVSLWSGFFFFFSWVGGC